MTTPGHDLDRYRRLRVKPRIKKFCFKLRRPVILQLSNNQDDQAANRGRFERVGRAVLDGSSHLTDFVGTVIDITERTRAEQELRQSEAELRTITDAIRQCIGVVAPDGADLYANRVALDYSGLTLDEVIKEGLIARLCHPDDINRVHDERRIALLEGAPFDFETRLLHKSGQYRWHLMQYNPLKDESGQIIRWYFTATDIDDRKRAEQELQRARRELLTITDAIANQIIVLAPDGSLLYANRVALDLTGRTLEEVKK